MDPDVAAAFGSTPSSTSTSSTISDPDVAAAFGGSGTIHAPPWMIAADKPIQGLDTAFRALPGAVNRVMRFPGDVVTTNATDVGLPIPVVAGLATAADYGTASLLGGREPETAEVQPVSTTDNSQSISAAAASPNITAASPELQQAVQDAGGSLNSDALSRHLEADSLPVPVKLTRGQATQDPTILSLEQNSRGAIKPLSDRFAEQNGQLAQNLQILRDQVGPDVFSTNATEHGDILIKAYQDKAAAADADINAKYQALTDANGGQFPIDAKTLQSNVSSALHSKLLYEHAPSAEMSQLQGAAENGMNMEQYEAMRTNLARIQRSSSDGNERAAAGIIRQQMEQLPLSGGAANLKPLADTARAAAKAQFDALDADPAYKAAVNETVSPDKFTQRFVTGPSATREGVQTMRTNLADNDTATQTMSVAALDHLRKSAGIDEMGNGNFSQANYNKNLQALGPRLGGLFDPSTQESLSTLGNVARYTQGQPRGAFVNNSNTATSLLGQHVAGLAEGAVNAKFAGIPVGTMLRNVLKGRAAKAFAQDSLEPGAGISQTP